MNIALAKTETRRAVEENLFTAARDRLPGTGKVLELRRQAFDAFEHAGLPHRRLEDWKYTDLRALMPAVLPLAAAPDETALQRTKEVLKSVAVVDSHRLVLIDGVLAPSLSNLGAPESGVAVQTLREVREDGSNAVRADLLENGAMSGPMVALNAAMVTDGAVITVADGAVLKKPLHIVHVATRSSAASHTRSFVKLGRAAHATLVESFVAAEDAKSYQVNDAVIIWLGDDPPAQHA